MKRAFHPQKLGETTIAHASHPLAFVARARRRVNQSGAALTEYSLLVIAVLICAGGAIKLLGHSAVCAGLNATDALPGDDGSGGSCGGGGSASASAIGASSGGANGAAGGASSGSGGGSNGVAADERGGGGGAASGGYVSAAVAYDDGAGGLVGASGSRGGSGFGASVGVGGGGGGEAGLGGSNAALVSKNGPEDQYASEGDNFAKKTAGVDPQKGDLTLAKLAMSTDGFNGKTPTKGAGGFVPLTKEQLANAGITQSMLYDPSSGYAAEVYTNGKGDYVVAYRGTQFPSSIGQAITDPKSLAGVATDVDQAAGINTKQYVEGARLGKAAKNAFGGNVVFTGHSLGGALAASSAAMTGLPAVTFNSAGVHDNTLRRDGVNPAAERAQAANGQVRDYEGKNELLSGAQDAHPGMAQALGHKIQFADPDPAATKAAAAQSNILNPWPLIGRRGTLHGEVVQGLEAGPVTSTGSDGKTHSYWLTDPPHS
jgi:hypothetical protein